MSFYAIPTNFLNEILVKDDTSKLLKVEKKKN